MLRSIQFDDRRNGLLGRELHQASPAAEVMRMRATVRSLPDLKNAGREVRRWSRSLNVNRGMAARQSAVTAAVGSLAVVDAIDRHQLQLRPLVAERAKDHRRFSSPNRRPISSVDGANLIAGSRLR